MRVVDRQGRLFGVVNLIDFLVGLFVLSLIPLVGSGFQVTRMISTRAPEPVAHTQVLSPASAFQDVPPPSAPTPTEPVALSPASAFQDVPPPSAPTPAEPVVLSLASAFQDVPPPPAPTPAEPAGLSPPTTETFQAVVEPPASTPEPAPEPVPQAVKQPHKARSRTRDDIVAVEVEARIELELDARIDKMVPGLTGNRLAGYPETVLLEAGIPIVKSRRLRPSKKYKYMVCWFRVPGRREHGGISYDGGRLTLGGRFLFVNDEIKFAGTVLRIYKIRQPGS